MLRKILAFVLGLIAGGVANMALVSVSNAMYPPPEGIDPNDFEAFRAHIEANPMPLGALLIVLAAHAGGSFVSGFVCGAIAKRRWYLAAAILGLLWTCGGIAMLFLLPAPLWFAIADVALYIPAALLGVHLGGSFFAGGSPQAEIPPHQKATAN
jgi:MFS family permease